MVTSWVGVGYRHPWPILLLFTLLTAIAIPIAGRLRIDTDFKKLLPHSYPRVQAMDATTTKVGDTGYFSVVVDFHDTTQSIAYIKQLAQALEASEYVRLVYYENPVEFMKKYRFLLLPLETLKKIHNYLAARKHTYNPFYLDLGDNTPAEEKIDMESVKTEYFEIENMQRYHISADGEVVAMQVRPKEAVTNIGFVKKMHLFLLAESQRVKAEGGFPDDMNIYVGGSLKNKLDEYSVILHDILSSAWISGLLILALLILFFRNPLTILAILLPLCSGLCWTFAITALTIGFLNTISAMLFVVLFGLGIDHGIHLVQRYLNEKKEGHRSQQAMEIAMATTGRATIASALTTACGFFLMMVTDFKGFSHLGFISGLAMIIILLAYFFALPSVVAIGDRRGVLSRYISTGVSIRTWKAYGRWIGRLPIRPIVWLIPFLLIGGAMATFSIPFNYDFDTLTGTVTESEYVKMKQGKVYTKSLTPGAVLFAPDDPTLDAMLTEFKARKRQDTTSPTIERVVTIRDFFPSDQDARIAEIKAAAAQITPLLLEETKDPEIRKILEHLRDAQHVGKITWEDVPKTAKEYFTPQGGGHDRIIFIFPSVELRHGKSAIAFTDDLAPMTLGGTTYIPTGGSLIFADMLRVVVDQGLWIFALSLTAIAITLYLQFRKVIDMAHTMLSLLLGLACMAIILVAHGAAVNFYNMAIFAAIVGMGIDTSIHLFSQWQHTNDVVRSIEELGTPVTASMLTTIAGYLGMISSTHPGLYSIGVLAVIGLGSCFVMALTIFPVYLRFLSAKRRHLPAVAA